MRREKRFPGMVMRVGFEVEGGEEEDDGVLGGGGDGDDEEAGEGDGFGEGGGYTHGESAGEEAGDAEVVGGDHGRGVLEVGLVGLDEDGVVANLEIGDEVEGDWAGTDDGYRGDLHCVGDKLLEEAVEALGSCLIWPVGAFTSRKL